VYLLTAWFTKPHYKLWKLCKEFNEKYNVTREDCSELKRYPTAWFSSSVLVQTWTCAKLPVISSVLWSKDVSDVFDMANDLKESNYGSHIKDNKVIYKKDAKEIRQSKEVDRQFIKESKKVSDNWNANKLSNQWGVTK
jgi:hypothetical protein